MLTNHNKKGNIEQCILTIGVEGVGLEAWKINSFVLLLLWAPKCVNFERFLCGRADFEFLGMNASVLYICIYVIIFVLSLVL